MEKRHDTHSDEKIYIPLYMRLKVCQQSLERIGVMGGSDHDTRLHERQGAAVADVTALINPNLSEIPHFDYL